MADQRRTMSIERRSRKRKPILLEARWQSVSRRHEARVDDVSLGGCFVNTYAQIELQEDVNLEIKLPSGEWLPLRGKVASYQPGVGFGMSFTSLNENEVTALKELMLSGKERTL